MQLKRFTRIVNYLPAILIAPRSSFGFQATGSQLQQQENFLANTCSVAAKRHPMSTTVGAQKGSEQDNRRSVLRVLALHGSGGNGEDFISRLEQFRDVLKDDYRMKLEVVALDAPFPRDGGLAWWTLPPGVRSFNAKEYLGFEESANLVLKAFHQPSSSSPPFDIVLAHSQGAILTTALLALGRVPHHPTRGYVLNGVAWPQPFSKELQSLTFQNDITGEDESPPRVLFITGSQDRINPPDSQERVKLALQKAGAEVDLISHPDGHGVPIMKRDETLKTIVGWIMQKQEVMK